MRHHNDRWKIESGTDFITGAPKWTTTPPRFVYGPRAEGKRSHDTYDQALAYVRTSKERRSSRLRIQNPHRRMVLAESQRHVRLGKDPRRSPNPCHTHRTRRGSRMSTPDSYESCGTPSGYRRHRRNDNEACTPCKKAQAEYMLQYRHDRGINKGRLIPDTLIKQHGIKVTA